jgi:hypothetical protein
VKTLISRFGFMFVMYIVLIIWMLLWKEVLSLDYKTFTLFVAFVIAPLTETLFFQYLPNKLGEMFDGQKVMMWVATIFFIWWHKDNYPIYGWYFACLQGGYGLVFWYVNQKYGYWYAVALHSKLNISLYFMATYL